MHRAFCAALIKFTPALHRLLTINITAAAVTWYWTSLEHSHLSKDTESNLALVARLKVARRCILYRSVELFCVWECESVTLRSQSSQLIAIRWFCCFLGCCCSGVSTPSICANKRQMADFAEIKIGARVRSLRNWRGQSAKMICLRDAAEMLCVCVPYSALDIICCRLINAEHALSSVQQ